MKKAAFLFFRVEVRNAACAVQYLVVVQTMLVRCPKNLDFTMFQKVSLSNLIFIQIRIPHWIILQGQVQILLQLQSEMHMETMHSRRNLILTELM